MFILQILTRFFPVLYFPNIILVCKILTCVSQSTAHVPRISLPLRGVTLYFQVYLFITIISLFQTKVSRLCESGIDGSAAAHGRPALLLQRLQAGWLHGGSLRSEGKYLIGVFLLKPHTGMHLFHKSCHYFPVFLSTSSIFLFLIIYSINFLL